MLTFKSDAELFADLPAGQGAGQDGERAFGRRYLEAADRYRTEIAQGSIQVEHLDGMWSAEEQLQMAMDGDARKVFQKLQSWIEGHLSEGVSIQQFPEPVIPLYAAGNPERLCKMDFFCQLNRDAGRLNELARPLRRTLRAQEPRRGLGKAVLQCFLWLVGSVFAAAIGASSSHTAVTLAFMGVMAVCLFQSLRAFLTRPRRVRKKDRLQAAVEFRQLAEQNLPRMHLLLRFYTLWAENQGIALPDSIVEIQRLFDQSAARYAELS